MFFKKNLHVNLIISQFVIKRENVDKVGMPIYVNYCYYIIMYTYLY